MTQHATTHKHATDATGKVFNFAGINFAILGLTDLRTGMIVRRVVDPTNYQTTLTQPFADSIVLAGVPAGEPTGNAIFLGRVIAQPQIASVVKAAREKSESGIGLDFVAPWTGVEILGFNSDASMDDAPAQYMLMGTYNADGSIQYNQPAGN
jgi:hypothetical protein